MRGLVMACMALAACGGGDGNGGNGNGETPLSRFEEIINVPEDVNVSGDFSCFTPATDATAVTWLLSAPGAAADTAGYTIDSWIEDFETEDEVYDADVSLWLDDSVDGSPDITGQADTNGLITLNDVPTCTAMTYKTGTDPILDRTKNTFKAHHFYSPPPSAADPVDAGSFLSVSTTTYKLIPTILGVTVDDDKSVIAGTAYDCSRDAGLPSDNDAGKVQGAQVIIYDEDGNIPDSLTVNYMTDSFPDNEQPYTSPDGLFVASNVPPGNLTIEMWGRVDGELVLLGASKLFSEASSINIANVFGGYGDGVKYPDACE